MATTIDLKVKDEQGNTNIEKVSVEEITLFQFQRIMKNIKEIFDEVQKDESLADLFEELFSEAEGKNEKDLDKFFIEKIIGSFGTLFEYFPDQAINLLSTFSGIDKDLLGKQKITTVFDVYDAVVDENDIEGLFKRAKKSFSKMKSAMKFLNFRRKATTSSQQS